MVFKTHLTGKIGVRLSYTGRRAGPEGRGFRPVEDYIGAARVAAWENITGLPLVHSL
jgi:hypothetical protein